MGKCLLPQMDASQDGVYQVYSLCFARVPERRVHDNFIRRDMHDGPMPDNDAFLDVERLIVIGVQDGAVLYVDARPKRHARQVRARPSWRDAR